MKYVIFSPRNNSGGVIALHVLCKYLEEQGENAKIFYMNRYYYKKGRHLLYWLHYPVFLFRDRLFCFLTKLLGEGKIKKYKTNSIIGCKRKWLPFVGKNTIVIYPDLVYGNPLRAKKVVRWLLYFYGSFYPDADDSWGENFGKNDLVFCYRKIFNDKRLNPTERMLCTPFFDLDLYKRTNFGKRKGKCYIIRKGSNRTDLPNSFDGIIIDNLSEKEKVKVLNECEQCISYDTHTAYSTIAAICGCVSVVVPENGKTRADYLNGGEIGFGRAYGFDEKEIQYAVDTQSKAHDYYLQLNNEGKDSALRFICECEKYFFEEKK